MDIDISGMLQIAWMVGDPHLSDVEKPELDKLRSAGMYILAPDTIVLRRLKSSSITQNEEGRASMDHLINYD